MISELPTISALQWLRWSAHWRSIVVAALVISVAVTSYAMAYLLRFNGEVPSGALSVFLETAWIVVAVRLTIAVFLRQRQLLSRFFSFDELFKLAQVVTLGTAAITLIDALLLPHLTIPRSVLLLDWGAAMVVLGAVHSVPRFWRQARWNAASQQTRVPALIVGANDAGEALLRAIQRSRKLGYRPVGFVDDRPRRHDMRIAGAPVLGGLEDLPALIKKHRIEQLLITSGELPGRQVRELMDLVSPYGCDIRVLPSYEQLLNDDVAVAPREVAITDLLRRPPVKLNNDEIRGWLRGRVVMVTGSAGSIGSELAKQLLALRPSKLVLVDRSETGQFFLDRELASLHPNIEREVVLADLVDRRRMQNVFETHRPDIVFHAAAYKHVPLMERHPGEAVKNIVVATRNLVDLAEENGAEGVVMISTDKAVNPTSVMGACKRVAEQYIQAKAVSSSCRLETVRFGNVLDSAGSVVPIFRQQIAQGGPVTVTHKDMIRYFMLIPEAARLVIQAGAMGSGGEIFVLDMGEPVRMMDLARDMIRLSGLQEGQDIEIAITGLRPGEKLYEELYQENERHKPTAHEKIMVAGSTPRNLLEVIADVNRLIDASDSSGATVRGLLREIVPSFSDCSDRSTRVERKAA